MKEIRIVLVEPMYQINLGYIARVAKNFGITSLSLVNPKCSYRGKQAIKYSKHARELLQRAKLFRSIGAATRGTFVMGTTAIWRKTGSSFYNVYDPRKALGLIKRNRISRVSILIGRDNIGLTKEELEGCDATVFIPTSDEYPAMNISHALAVLLYAFSSGEKWKDQPGAPSRKEVGRVSRLFEMMVSRRKDIRDKKAVTMAFNHIIKRSAPTKKELGALSVALSPRRQ